MNFPGFPPGTQRPLMIPEGRGTSGILVCAEALGEHEENDRLPLRPYGEAGSVFERALYRAGIPRDSLTITNLVWYRPPRNYLEGSPWEMDAIRACQGMNDDLVSRVQPKVILALGGLAMRELSGFSGEKAGIGMTRGFQVIAQRYGIPMVGTYHPSYLRRGSKEREATGAKGKVAALGGGTQGMSLLGVLIRDILLAQEIALNGPKRFKFDDYVFNGTVQHWLNALERLRENPSLPISYDFETIDSLVVADESEMEITRRDVTQVQISWRVGQALVSDWVPELRAPLKAILELPNPKIDWNGRKFDRPILREMEIRTDLGEWHDGMDFWHHSQPDLPRGLQYATSFHCPEVGPWKHLSVSDPHWYGALDVDMPQRIFVGLRQSLGMVRHPLSGISLLSGYQDQVVRLAPVLDRMSARGIPISEEKRLELDKEFTATLERLTGECQPLVPERLKNVSPKLGYVRTPPEMWVECHWCGGEKKIPAKADIVGICDACDMSMVGAAKKLHGLDCPARKSAKMVCGICRGAGKLECSEPPEGVDGFVRREFTDEVKCGCDWSKTAKKGVVILGIPDCSLCNNTGKFTCVVLRWCLLLPFNPDSPDQVLRYIKHQREEDIGRKTEWKVPIDHKTKKETTAADELARLARKTGDLLLPKIGEYKEVSKARGTYVRGWKPGEDGRVHPNFGFKPSTPQLSSDSPNAQNFPQHADIAHRMKQMIHAGVGKKMVKFDWKSFHIVTGAFEAQDKDYLRIARIDTHSFVTLVGLLKLERPELAFAWTDDQLRETLAWYRAQEKLYANYARPGFAGGMSFNQIRDYIAKRVDFGWEFGQGAYSLWQLWQETFKDVKEAEQCQATLRELFPRVDKWQSEVRQKADTDHCLMTRFGHIRRFWDVYQRKPVQDSYVPRGNEKIWQHKSGQRWLLKPGDDHEAVVAYLPASDAFGIKRISLREIGERGWDEEYGLICDVHDDVRFECENTKIPELIHNVKGLMEEKCSFLVDPIVAPDGLWCAADVAIGEDWDTWEKWRG